MCAQSRSIFTEYNFGVVESRGELLYFLLERGYLLMQRRGVFPRERFQGSDSYLRHAFFVLVAQILVLLAIVHSGVSV